MLILVALLIQLAPVQAQDTCAGKLTIVRTTVTRPHDVADQYQFGQNAKKHAALRVHRRDVDLSELKTMGLGRVSRAMRGLNLTGEFDQRLATKVRLIELNFQVPWSQAERHRDWNGISASVRQQFATDFAEREALLTEVLNEDRDVPAVYMFSPESGMLEWHDLEEVAKRGPTRFATKTWLAQFFRRHRVKGAILLNGQLPEVSPPEGEAPYRLSAEEVRRLDSGLRILFFRPAQP